MKQIQKGIDVCQTDNPKIKALYQTLVRKNLVIDCQLGVDGKEVLSFVGEKEELEFIPRSKKKDAFDAWWSTYPATDTFKIGQRVFKGTRALRVKKEDCKAKFLKIIAEGFTVEELVSALECEVNQKKENSVKTGENKLKYMQNSLTYLNQRTWEPYVELIKQGLKTDSPKEQSTGVDI